MPNNTIHFSKMHGLGNDFVVIETLTRPFKPTQANMRFIADRHYGIGCDQVLLLEKAAPPADFAYRVFNADGTESGQCGNGARCLALFARTNNIVKYDTMQACIQGQTHIMQILNPSTVKVNMGQPILQPDLVPFSTPEQAITYSLTTDLGDFDINAISMGNPHAVLHVGELATTHVDQLGHCIANHPQFPQQTNVGFMQIQACNHILLRVYERGVGETNACGSGACAAMVAARLRGLVENKATISLLGGDLSLEWRGEGSDVWMTGPATHVFSGEIERDRLGNL